MAKDKETKQPPEQDVHTGGIAVEGELGTAGAGRKRGSSSSLAGAATGDEEDTPEFPSTPKDEPHRGRGTGVKDDPRSGKAPAKPK